MNRSQYVRYKKLEKELSRRAKYNICLDWFNQFYPWQVEFCAETATHYESCLMAANQVGKTRTGVVLDAFHLTGDYPKNWPGYKFEKPPLIWALGYSMEKTRDILQKVLFGAYEKNKGFEGGLVTKDKIVSWESATGIPNAVRTVRVKHKKGISSIQFWSYSQGQHALMGDKIDWFHVDEEPRDQTIRPQVLRGTINGDQGRGGRGIYTFTPENGRTDLVIKFMDNPSIDQFFMKKGWDDAPHMTMDKRERLLEQFPEHQRDMRSKGEPMLGHGRIYDIDDELMLCDPVEIPDFWKVMIGIDFGYSPDPQAIVKLVHDPDNDVIYLTNSWKAVEVSPNDAWGATKKWVKSYPVAWPLDGLHKESRSTDSAKVVTLYKEAGFNMLYEHATWLEEGRSVEAGIFDLITRAKKGLFKVFRGQHEFMDEWKLYHRDEKGNIVKVKDHMLDAARIARMMLRYATYSKLEKKKVKLPKPIGVIGIGAN